MGEIRPKKCEGVGITWLAAPVAEVPLNALSQTHFAPFSPCSLALFLAASLVLFLYPIMARATSGWSGSIAGSIHTSASQNT